MKKRYIKRDRFDDDDQRIFQYITDYIVDYEGYDPDFENLVDEMKIYAMNFTISASKPSRSHSSAPIKPEFDNLSINYYHDDVVTDPETSDRYDYAYY